MTKTLEACSLSKQYGKRMVLDSVDLSIEPGEIVGLLGPNGAGKSTFIKLASGLIWPSRGQVAIHGHDVHSEHPEAMAKLGAIIEWPHFYADLSARENLYLFTGARGREFDLKLAEIADFVEISSYLDRKAGSFSTGMKQRLGIALALLPDSSFVILDEPTNGLDPNGIVEIRQIISEFNRRFGTTVLLSSHLLGEIEQICHRVAILRQGKLIACGDLEQLLGSRARFEIECDRSMAALALLREAGFTGDSGEGERLFCEGDDSSAARANRLLVEKGFEVRQLCRHRHTLEEFFLEKVNEDVA